MSLSISAVMAAELYYFDQLESTNKTAEQLARGGVPEGTVVVADMQTGGKGRKGNTWFSPAGTNLYFSLILRPPMDRLHFLPFLAGLAVAKSLQEEGLKPDLKWPNDILVAGKKISGILIETSIEQNQLSYAVIGVGINVNQTEFPEELQFAATSVSRERGTQVSREKILTSVLSHFDLRYRELPGLSWDSLASDVERHSTYVRGAFIRMIGSDGTVEGVTAGLDSFGGLIVDTSSGPRTFYAGEVQECRKN